MSGLFLARMTVNHIHVTLLGSPDWSKKFCDPPLPVFQPIRGGRVTLIFPSFVGLEPDKKFSKLDCKQLPERADKVRLQKALREIRQSLRLVKVLQERDGKELRYLVKALRFVL